MERAEGRHGVGNDNGVDSGCRVGNGVARGRVDVVVDNGGMLVQEPNQSEHYSNYNQNMTSQRIVVVLATSFIYL